MQSIILLAIGLSAGVLSVVMGVGGGIIIVPSLIAVVGMKSRSAMATSLAVIIPTALAGVILKAQAREVNWRTALVVALGAVAGAMIGDKLGRGASDVLLKRLFAGLLLFTAMRLAISTLPSR